MLKRQISTFSLVSCLAVSAYADYPQKIEVCLFPAASNYVVPFEARFKSTDIFDFGTSTGNVPTEDHTIPCAQHTYQHGPKNIHLEVKAIGVGDLKDVEIFPDANCEMTRRSQAHFETGIIRTSQREETWVYNITQIPARNGYKSSFALSCKKYAR